MNNSQCAIIYGNQIIGFQRELVPFGGGLGGNAPESSPAGDEIPNQTLAFGFGTAVPPEKRSARVNFEAIASKEGRPAREGVLNSREAATISILLKQSIYKIAKNAFNRPRGLYNISQT